MRSDPCRALLLSIWVAAVGVSPALAISGRVIDPEGKPVKGARACLLVSGVEGLCVETGQDGDYTLLQSRLPKVRISAAGFLPRTVAAVDQEHPIVLDRAASLRVRLLEFESGEPVDDGTVTLSYSTGRRLGPFPCSEGGLFIRTLPPGEVMASANAEGFLPATGHRIVLVAGEEGREEISLFPAGRRSPAGDDPD